MQTIQELLTMIFSRLLAAAQGHPIMTDAIVYFEKLAFTVLNNDVTPNLPKVQASLDAGFALVEGLLVFSPTLKGDVAAIQKDADAWFAANKPVPPTPGPIVPPVPSPATAKP